MKKKILIIEDDPSISEALTLALEVEGYETIQVLDAAEALPQALRFKPDLILLDLLLSGVEGSAVSKEIKGNAKTKHIPIILMSAHPQAENTSKEMKVEGYIAKPFNLEDLTQKVSSFMK